MGSDELAPRRGPKSLGRPGVWTWIVGGIVTLFAAIAASVSGVTGVLTVLAIAAVITGLYILATGRRSWARIPGGRKMGAAALGVALVLFIIAALTAPPSLRDGNLTETGSESDTTAPASPTETATPTPTPTPSDTGTTNEKAPEPAPAPPPPPAPEPAPPPPPPPAPPPAPAPEPYYASCDAAWAAGAAPLYAGTPGYRPGLDRDKDGVACETP